MVIGIGLMVVLWLVVMLSRHTIYAYWWGRELRTAATPAEQLYYLQRLAGLGEASVPVAADLLRSEDAGLRSFGVALLSTVPAESAKSHLLAAVHDADPDIRRLVLDAYSRKDGNDVAKTLQRLMNDDDVTIAMQATARFVLSRPDDALPALLAAARDHRHVGVRVQAIQALGINQAGRAIDLLIECLDDMSVFAGRTATEDSAARAFEAVASTRSAAADGTPRRIEIDSVHVIGDEAAKALRAITGESFGYRADDEPRRTAATSAWQRWRESRTQP